MIRGLAIAALLATSFAGSSQAAVKRRKPTPAAAVSARQRDEALAFVRRRAEASPDAIENPAALVPFFDRLSRQPFSGLLHVMQYGDSHTASDDWANTMREGLQARFGGGGSGFALAGHPYRGYRRFDLTGSNSKGWSTEGTVGRPGDGRNGLGGVSISTQAVGETVSLTADCSELTLFYLRQPGGGELAFEADGAPVETISTGGELGAGYFSYQQPPGPHTFALRTLSAAPVKLFGWAADNRAGVTYASLGINGAQASLVLDWDETILAGELARHDPALIVIAYGTNEALNPRWDPESYADTFSQVVERFRRAAPAAVLLVIGPPDCQFRSGRQRPYYGHLTQIIALQRRIAIGHGCAFWDWRERMGGEGSVIQWARAGLGQPDRVHLTGDGYRMTGGMLLEDFMEQYRRFQAVKAE